MLANAITNLKLSTLLLLTASLLACGEKRLITDADQNIKLDYAALVQAEEQEMRVKLGDFSFTLPDSWRDTSSYTYKSKQKNIALTVSFGKSRGDTSLDALVAERRAELTDAMGDEIEFLSQQKGKIATLPAKYISFSFGDGDDKYLEHWAMAYYGENDYVILSYVGPIEDESLQTTFEHIMTSSQPSARPSTDQANEDYVWRQASVLRLQVPEKLHPPRHYTYASSDGTVKLKASLYNPGDSWPETTVEDEAAKDLRFGGTKGDSSEDYRNNLSIEQINYVFQGGDPLEPIRHSAHRAHVASFGGRLFLSIKGFESQAEKIDVFWQQLINNLVESSTGQGESS